MEPGLSPSALYFLSNVLIEGRHHRRACHKKSAEQLNACREADRKYGVRHVLGGKELFDKVYTRGTRYTSSMLVLALMRCCVMERKAYRKPNANTAIMPIFCFVEMLRRLTMYRGSRSTRKSETVLKDDVPRSIAL